MGELEPVLPLKAIVFQLMFFPVFFNFVSLSSSETPSLCLSWFLVKLLILSLRITPHPTQVITVAIVRAYLLLTTLILRVSFKTSLLSSKTITSFAA